MHTLKTLWASVELTPKKLQRVHGWLTIFWAAMLPIAIITGWVYVVVFVSVISIYANFAGHFSAWQAARTEVKQEQEAKRREELHG